MLQGQVEADVEELGFERYSIYRPAYVPTEAIVIIIVVSLALCDINVCINPCVLFP